MSADWSWFNDSSVLIEARNQTGAESATNEPIFDDTHPTQIYSGPANAWIESTSIETLQAGEVAAKVLKVIVDAMPLPANVAAGNRITWNGERFKIASVVYLNADEVSSIEIAAHNQETW